MEKGYGMKEMSAIDETQENERESVANAILQRLSKIAAWVDETNAKVNDKLTPIMRESHGEPNNADKDVAEEYPPLFTAMRKQLELIEASLSGINKAIDRTEI